MQLQVFLPLVTYPQANSDEIARSAVCVAQWLEGKLHALAINADIPDVSTALSRVVLNTGELIKGAETESRHRGSHLLSLLNRTADAAGLPIQTSSIQVHLATLGDTAANHARYFDMSVLGWEPENPTTRSTAEAVIFGAGRPAVICPAVSAIDEFDHVSIAWDGSRAAARAVADAQPFLKRAARITIITITGEKPLGDQHGAVRLTEILRQSGLNAEARSVAANHRPIAEMLQQTAIEQGSQLLVMGGYGHSRIRDFVLGGATRGVLASPLLPILLSH